MSKASKRKPLIEMDNSNTAVLEARIRQLEEALRPFTLADCETSGNIDTIRLHKCHLREARRVLGVK